MEVRPAAVAGTFYPADKRDLEQTVAGLLAAAPAGEKGVRAPKAIIAPHAGYEYSGLTAARVYRQLEGCRERVHRVVLLGPAHRVHLQGMALPSVDAFTTPLGDVPIDARGVRQALGVPGTRIWDAAHATEHSLEVHLPFLQTVLDDFALVPIIVGACPAQAVADVLEALWGADETLIVASSDLSHFHSYADAREIDAQTRSRIEARESTLHAEEACGAGVLNGLMLAARSHGLRVRTVDLRNSGDTAGDRSRVVGYGAFSLA